MTLVETSREPLRPVVADHRALTQCLNQLAHAEGPVGFDVERAHGYRYWPKAYLLQIRRGAAGTWLIDPTRFTPEELGQLASCTADAEWIIHAASQDLPCMFEAGIVPSRLFDSELAARLMGKPGVSLQALLSAELGIELRKAYSAVNWSTRPLPAPWLTYAALDVDFLAELRDVLETQLREMHRRQWAAEEFAWELATFAQPLKSRSDPWRHTSHITTVRHPRGLALVRELWQERDAIARKYDSPPTHILPDWAIIGAGRAADANRPLDSKTLRRLPGFDKLPGKQYMPNWQQAVARFTKLPPHQYPPKRVHNPDAIPPPKSWDRHDADAADRWNQARPAIDEFACEIGIQPSLLAPPASLRAVLWHHECPTTDDLLHAGMRPWQAELLSGLFEQLFG